MSRQSAKNLGALPTASAAGQRGAQQDVDSILSHCRLTDGHTPANDGARVQGWLRSLLAPITAGSTHRWRGHRDTAALPRGPLGLPVSHQVAEATPAVSDLKQQPGAVVTIARAASPVESRRNDRDETCGCQLFRAREGGSLIEAQPAQLTDPRTRLVILYGF